MPPSQQIVDFNRCFQPNAFNTGPAIPSTVIRSPLLDLGAAKEIHSPFPRLGALNMRQTNIDIPALSNSPESITSSTTSLSLNDEEIKKIFSRPPNRTADDVLKKEDLNPRAVPFFPSVLIYGESPYGDSYSPNCQAYELSRPSSSSVVPKIPPTYLPFLQASLKSSTASHEREVLVKLIITSHPVWDVEHLLELAQNICRTGFGSWPEIEGQGSPACHPSRYAGGKMTFAARREYSEESQMAKDVALVTAEIHRQFSALKGEEVAQAFAWNVRELVLMEFIQSWDSSKSGAITHAIPLSVRYVRSSLLLCKGVAALFTTDLIGRDHIRMCISVLLKDLMSVEHVEAVHNIVLGCGQAFWSETDAAIPPRKKALYISDHASDFITGLHANYSQRNLQDCMSVIDQPWGEGQLLSRLEEIVDNVRVWESALLASL